MTLASAPRRSLCTRCTRPGTACICHWIRPHRIAPDLLILQHPLEVSNAKGSARLLHLSVTGSTMVPGEVFDEASLAALLHGDGRRPLLLYPDNPGERALGLPAPPVLDVAWLAAPASLRLVVLDGTWRKSRKMLYLNRLLHALPRLPLVGMAPSRYRIRKAHAPDQLSTLEASCHALAQLEGEPDKFHDLLDAFDGMVDTVAGRLTPEHVDGEKA